MTRLPRDTVRFVEVDGRRLRVDDRRGSDPRVPLLLCNGIGANLELWDPFLAKMDRPTITFDAPGVGGSSVGLLPSSLRTIARRVGTVLDRMEVEAVDVLGLSWGGALAQQLARAQGDRIRRLVLASTLAGWTAVPGSPRVLARMVSPKRYRDPDYLLRIAGLIYGGDVRDNPDFLRDHGHQRFLRQAGTRGYLWQLVAPWGWTSLPWLHRLGQQTLVLCGDDDPIIPVVNARVMAARLRHSRLHVVRGGGHLCLLTRADELGPLVADFLTDDDPLPPDTATASWRTMLASHLPGR